MENIAFKAFLFADRAHKGQVRKYTGEPYITHPVAVAELVLKAGYGANVVAAALLHDVIEDTAYDRRDVGKAFGDDVLSMVEMVTDVSRPSDGNRKKRKNLDLLHIAEASFYGKTIKLADLIHNSSSILEADDSFAKVYMKEKRKLLEVLKDADEYLYDKAKGIVDDFLSNHQGA